MRAFLKGGMFLSPLLLKGLLGLLRIATDVTVYENPARRWLKGDRCQTENDRFWKNGSRSGSGSLRGGLAPVETGRTFCCCQRNLPYGEKSEPMYFLLTDLLLRPSMGGGEDEEPRLPSLAFQRPLLCLAALGPHTLPVTCYSRP